MKIQNLEFDLPSFYIGKSLEETTFDICRKETTNIVVVKKLYMIKNEVRPDYYFMETPPHSGYFLTAKVQPNFAFYGEARKQLEKEKKFGALLDINPSYKIKAVLYREKDYEKEWEFEHITKNKKEIYKVITNLRKFLEKDLV
tara:strand:- start:4909 stop:5337 length:429 start_codon:yes stop_codon:yes gene_type:complete